MDWATAVFAVVTVILFVQGCSILRRSQHPPHVRWYGWFTLLLANLALLSFLLFSWGLLVLSPEFGLVMVQGSLAWYGLAVLLVGTAIMAALGWHIACFGAGLPMRLPWLFSIGVIVGLMAVSRLRLLNPADLEPFRAYSYDLWWPPLLIWFSVCL